MVLQGCFFSSVTVITRISKTMCAKQARWHMEMHTSKEKAKGKWNCWNTAYYLYNIGNWVNVNRVLLSKHHRCTVEKNHYRCSLQVYMCLFVEIMGRRRMLMSIVLLLTIRLLCHLFFDLTNRFHVAVRLFSNRSQMMSKCGKNKEVAHEPQASACH